MAPLTPAELRSAPLPAPAAAPRTTVALRERDRSFTPDRLDLALRTIYGRCGDREEDADECPLPIETESAVEPKFETELTPNAPPFPTVDEFSQVDGEPAPINWGELESEYGGTLQAEEDGNEPVAAEVDDLAPPHHERREHARHQGICLVSIAVPVERLTLEEQPWELHQSKFRGHMIDVSNSGLAFLAHQEIEAGTEVLIRMANFRLGTSLDTSGQVLRCEPFSGDRQRIVCTFDYPLTDDQVRNLSKQLFDAELV